RLAAAEAAADARAFAGFLAGNFLAATRPAGVQGGQGVDVKVSDALAKAEADIPAVFAGRPAAEALARDAVGVTWRNLGKYDRAEANLRRAVELRERTDGPDHPNTLDSVNCLAVLLAARGDHRAAEPLHRRALAGREAALGPDHPDTLRSVKNLAVLLRTRGDLEAAEPLLRRALAGYEKALGPDHPGTLDSVNCLAVLLAARGDHRAAELLYRRALAGWEKALGPDHPGTLMTVNNLAALYWSTGRLDLSVPLFEGLLPRWRRVLGDDHPETLRTAANLGVNYTDSGRPAEGVPLLERAYAARTKDPAGLGWVGAQLANAYAAAGRPADAVRVFGEELTEQRALNKPGGLGLSFTLATFGKRLVDLDPVAAEPVVRECLELRQKLGTVAWAIASAKSLLGEVLLRQGKYAEAEPLLLAGYEGLKAEAKNIPPQGRQNVPEAADRLVELYGALGKPAEVAKWRAERANYPPPAAPPPRPVNRP
ncbi:MAG: tetratricopeptide repeat protein, partial [Gemmataceae bacterium]|nr:tetratricopeptide repeat protein [Gemmataceae bacterium]